MKPIIQHILVPTDFSGTSAAAIRYAVGLAKDLSGRLHLVHVLERPFVTPGPYEFVLPDNPTRHQRQYQLALAELRRVAATVQGVDVSVEVRDGTPLESIAQASIDYGADLIVLGTQRRSGLRHLMAGSATERLLRLVDCPVLAVPASNESEAARTHERGLVA